MNEEKQKKINEIIKTMKQINEFLNEREIIDEKDIEKYKDIRLPIGKDYIYGKDVYTKGENGK